MRCACCLPSKKSTLTDNRTNQTKQDRPAIALAGLWPDIRNTISPEARILEGNRIEVPVGNDGHYHLTAQVNGVAVRFVIDTGASSIALGPRDAERVGIEQSSASAVVTFWNQANAVKAAQTGGAVMNQGTAGEFVSSWDANGN